MYQPVVEYPALVVGCVMDLEVEFEGLFVGPEPLAGDESNGSVGPDLDGEFVGGAVVVEEHLCDLRIDIVSRVRADAQVLWEEELPDDEPADIVCEHVYRLECGRHVPRVFDMNLDW